MLNFVVDQESCTQCGLCVADCPVRIITMEEDAFPEIAPERETACYRCQHCLAICPTGAVSILGIRPEDSLKLARNLPVAKQMETLIKGRRSVRRYKDEDLEPDLIQKLLEVAWHAPTGVNSRQVRFSVVDARKTMATFRAELMTELRELIRDNKLPEAMGFFADFLHMWDENGVDVIFRGAPHMVVASAPEKCPSPLQDCMIALSYFELYAQTCGVGTVWSGLAKWAINDLLPQSRVRLGIPDDHVIGYAMVFGKPASRFMRTVQHGPPIIHRVSAVL